MMLNCDYTPDGKFLTLPGRSGPKTVPVAFIDEMIERELTKTDVERLMAYRTLTADMRAYTKTTIGSLVGKDLTGKNIHIRLWDSENIALIRLNNVATVEECEETDSGGSYYSLVLEGELQEEDFEYQDEAFRSDELVIIEES